MGWSTSTRVIAIRHGETAWNVDERIQGMLDIGLNDNGLRQAQRMAAALVDEGIESVYSSDLARARDTAQCLAQVCSLPLHIDAALRERGFGVFEGLSFHDIEQRYPDECLRWRKRDPSFGPEGGERLRDFFDRSIAAFAKVAATHPGQTIAVVTHGGVLDCLYRAATQVDLQAPRTWKVANTSVNRVLYTGESFTLIGWGDVQHLDEEPLETGWTRHLASPVRDEASDGGAATAPAQASNRS